MNEFNTRLIKKVQAQSLRSVIYDQLEDMILTGVLAPGERINESKLSVALKVSRAPIREACRQLEKHGMVQIIPRRGTFVTKIEVSDVKELYDIRASLESLAAEKSATNATPKEQQEFQDILETMKEAIKADDAKHYFKANMIFHRKIVLTSRNANLESLIEGIYNKASLYRRTNLSALDRMSISYKQHKDIYKAILAGNPMEASTQMKHHVIDARDALLNSLNATMEGVEALKIYDRVAN
ncbi:MAG: GntR family transcriptional regulator [Desulfobacterales bacterium]|nr:GntR family transcriptional regulator [Deltaproteobacteria bacterium]NNK96392.1 GntR family transcriptional regulator [Desulfobacterales bacterium]